MTKGRSRKELDILLAQTPDPGIALFKRINWLAEILTWIFSESPFQVSELSHASGHPQALRVKWLLHVLERNPEWKEKVARLLPSVAKETSIFDLLVTSGLHQQSGLISEFIERFQRRWLPRPPDDTNLEHLFSSAFLHEADAASIQRLDSTTLEGVVRLFLSFEPTAFETWKQNTFDAISHLSLQVAALGSHAALRTRGLRANDVFFQLQLQTLRWLDEESSLKSDFSESDPPMLQLLPECFKAIEDVYTHMDENGVSVDLVYHLERMKALMSRIEILLHLFTGGKMRFSPPAVQTLLASIVYASVHSRSLRALFDDNTALIAKKIAENSAETGEHYIARTPEQQAELVRSAIGGGAITAVTTILKFLIASMPGSPFMLSFFASLNYCASFLVIQLQGFSLATKQPAMTAAALADQIGVFDDPIREVEHSDAALDPVVNEMITVLRSQSLAVIGNLLAVVPGVFLLCGSFGLLTGSTFLTPEKATYTLHSFSLLGPTPFYAAWTGVLLFGSSLCAGWFYHWVLFRRLPQALARSPRLVNSLGPEKTLRFAAFFKRNAAGFAGNISLGFLLGLSPAIFQFLGLPLDVRHVTLSTGSLVASIMTLGGHVMLTWPFWLAVAGIVSMAFLNLLVSFALALAVALRSKRVSGQTAGRLVRVFIKRVSKRPTLLFRSGT